MTDDNTDTDGLWADASGGKQYEAEGGGPPQRDLPSLVADHLIEIDQGGDNSIAARDDRLAALIRALDDADELERVVEALVDEANMDPSDAKVNQSGVIKAAVRVGLAEVVPDVLDDAREGRRAYQDHTSSGY